MSLSNRFPIPHLRTATGRHRKRAEFRPYLADFLSDFFLSDFFLSDFFLAAGFFLLAFLFDFWAGFLSDFSAGFSGIRRDTRHSTGWKEIRYSRQS